MGGLASEILNNSHNPFRKQEEKQEEINFQEQFEDMTNWCKQNPGNRNFSCQFCGIYTAGKARCNKCKEER